MNTSPEIFPIVNEQGDVIGKETRTYCHSGSKVLHPVVHLHVFNKNGDLFLQKRSEHKDIQPGKWDTAVGGHIDYGENAGTALMREAGEELNIKFFVPSLVLKYVFESEIEKELIYSYITEYEGPFTPDKTELDDGRFWPVSEIKNNLNKNIFTPNFVQEFQRLINIGVIK